MKNLKKVLALIVVAMMLLASVSALAETTVVNTKESDNTQFTITVQRDSSDKAAHTYGAYQIFKGDLAETKDAEGKVTKKVLSNITWGTGIDSSKVTALITDLKQISPLASIADNAEAKDIAKALSDATLDNAQIIAVADAFNKALSATHTDGTLAADTNSVGIKVKAGYYLIKDVGTVSGEGAQTRFMLEVVSDVTKAEKASVPSVDKKVAEKNDTTQKDDATLTYQDAADWDIGDDVPYKITGTLPSTFAEYKSYKTYTFSDTLSEGLTAPAQNAITVKTGNDDITSLFDVSVSGQTITVSLKSTTDLKTATHGESNTKFAANDTIVVEYTAKLNDKAKIGSVGNPNTVTLTFSNNPNSDGSGTPDTGTTPPDTVIVFTYEIKADKVNESKNPLKGAGFTLYKYDADSSDYVKVHDEIKGENLTSFAFTGYDAGKYKLVETTVPSGYNKANDIVFVVVAEYDTEDNRPALKSVVVKNESNEVISGTDKPFVIESQEYTGNKGTTDTTDDVTVSSTYARAKVVIQNNPGTELPSTGGIGTTIFYVAGSILVLAAAILLITKRRMGSND